MDISLFLINLNGYNTVFILKLLVNSLINSEALKQIFLRNQDLEIPYVSAEIIEKKWTP